MPSKDRSFSERPQLLTPIKENVARSPRPRSLDNLTGEEFHGREGCIMEISEADGPVLFTMEGANLGQGAQSFLSGTTSSGSWVNISRNDEVKSLTCWNYGLLLFTCHFSRTVVGYRFLNLESFRRTNKTSFKKMMCKTPLLNCMCPDSYGRGISLQA